MTTPLPPPPPVGEPVPATSLPFGEDVAPARDPALVARVVELVHAHGPAETARRTGLLLAEVREIARQVGYDDAGYAEGVRDARARLDARRQLEEVRRVELRDALLLAAERAVDRLIAELTFGKAQYLASVSKAAKDALDAYRLEADIDVPADETHDDVTRRVLELRDDLAARRRAHGASGGAGHPSQGGSS